MIKVDYVRYTVHRFLNNQHIMHYCQGKHMFNSDFCCLVFCLQGQKMLKDVSALLEYDGIESINVIYSQKSDYTYLEVLF